MPDTQKRPLSNTAQTGKEKGSQTDTISPTRHVGPTLEAEGVFVDALGHELPIAAENAGGSRLDGRDAIDALEVRGPQREPGALRTRLPGDTSSDPHTDLGPDNASTAHASAGN